MSRVRYSPTEIVACLEASQSAGYVAETVAAFWPTIKAALIEYEKAHPDKVEPFQEERAARHA